MKAVPVMQRLSSLFWKDMLELFAGILLELLGKDRLHEEDKKAKMTLLRTGCVLRGFVPSQELYNGEEWFIREPKSWPQ